jgi:hypothetical protein
MTRCHKLRFLPAQNISKVTPYTLFPTMDLEALLLAPQLLDVISTRVCMTRNGFSLHSFITTYSWFCTHRTRCFPRLAQAVCKLTFTIAIIIITRSLVDRINASSNNRQCHESFRHIGSMHLLLSSTTSRCRRSPRGRL